jgi:hypothetical protein
MISETLRNDTSVGPKAHFWNCESQLSKSIALEGRSPAQRLANGTHNHRARSLSMTVKIATFDYMTH